MTKRNKPSLTTITTTKTTSVNAAQRLAMIIEKFADSKIGKCQHAAFPAIQIAAAKSITAPNARRERLGLAVAIRMFLVRRRGGDDDAAPDDQRIENVRKRFRRVRDERVRMAEDSREKFCRAQNDVHRDP